MTAARPNAADLPEGSIVASRYAVAIAAHPPGVAERWNDGCAHLSSDRDAQELLDLPGGAVVRFGYPLEEGGTS